MKYYWVVRKIGDGKAASKMKLESRPLESWVKAEDWKDFLETAQLEKPENRRFDYFIIGTDVLI